MSTFAQIIDKLLNVAVMRPVGPDANFRPALLEKAKREHSEYWSLIRSDGYDTDQAARHFHRAYDLYLKFADMDSEFALMVGLLLLNRSFYDPACKGTEEGLQIREQGWGWIANSSRKGNETANEILNSHESFVLESESNTGVTIPQRNPYRGGMSEWEPDELDEELCAACLSELESMFDARDVAPDARIAIIAKYIATRDPTLKIERVPLGKRINPSVTTAIQAAAGESTRRKQREARSVLGAQQSRLANGSRVRAELPPGLSWPTETYSGSPEAKRGGSGIVAYLERVWLPLLQAGAADRRTLAARDPSAIMAIKNYVRPHPLTGERRELPLHFPTLKEVNDRLLTNDLVSLRDAARLGRAAQRRQQHKTLE